MCVCAYVCMCVSETHGDRERSLCMPYLCFIDCLNANLLTHMIPSDLLNQNHEVEL